MRKTSTCQSGVLHPRTLVALSLISIGLVVASYSVADPVPGVSV